VNNLIEHTGKLRLQLIVQLSEPMGDLQQIVDDDPATDAVFGDALFPAGEKVGHSLGHRRIDRVVGSALRSDFTPDGHDPFLWGHCA